MVTEGHSRLQQVTEQQVTAGYRVVTVGYRKLHHVTELLQWVAAGYSTLPKLLLWVTAGYSTLPSGYCGLQQVTVGYRVGTVCYNRIPQVTEWLQWVRAVYSKLQSG